MEQRAILIIVREFPPYDQGRVGHSIRAHSLANYLCDDLKVFVYINELSVDKVKLEMSNPKINFIINENDEVKTFDESLSFIIKSIRHYKISTLISTGPPLSNHLLATQIKSQIRSLQWIMDVRDLEHTHLHLRNLGGASQRDTRLREFSLMAKADLITVTSEHTRRYLIASMDLKVPSENIVTVENGFIRYQENLNARKTVLDFVAKAKSTGKKIIYYAGTGSILGSANGEKYKDLTSFLEAITSSDKLKMRLSVIIQGVIRVNQSFVSKLNGQIDLIVLRPVDNQQMLANLRHADIGLSVCNDSLDSSYILGGKLYDYLGSGLRVVCLYPSEPTALLEFNETNGAGLLFGDINSMESIRQVIKEALCAPISEVREGHPSDLSFALRYNRNLQYGKILNLIYSK